MNAKRIVSNRSRLARLFFTARVLMAAALLSPGMRAQTVPDKHSSETIQQMSSSFESLARHGSPAVVEILVTGFSADTDQDEDNRSSGSFARERSLGSGVIIDPNGYIVTNHQSGRCRACPLGIERDER
jgi:serine protease Do